MRLRHGGSARRWGLAIYLASNHSYKDQIWFTGSPQQALDLACGLYVTNAGT